MCPSVSTSLHLVFADVKKSKSSGQEDTARMDEILDKIKEKGYDSLSKEEKAYLFKISNKE